MCAKIDEIDMKIINALIKDARTKLKDMADICGITSVAILRRIKRLKDNGIIIGATLFPNVKAIGGVVIATLGIDLEAGKEEEVVKIIQEQTNLIEPSPSIGRYDLCALVFAENLETLEKVTQTVKKHSGVKRVATNLWVSEPAMMYEKLELNKRSEPCGQA